MQLSRVQVPPSQRLIYVRDLLRELVVRDIKLRYKRSVLGIGWALVNPLTQILIFTFLFNKVVPLNIPNYTEFVFTGVLAWTWFQTGLFLGAGSIVDNRDLVRRPGFPVAIMPAVTVATTMIHFLLALPVLLLFLFFDGGRLSPALAALPVIMVVQFVLTLGLCYITAAAQVIFRDTQHLLGIALMMLFYLTPVFYRADAVPAQYQAIYKLNPMGILLGAYRAAVTGTPWPDPVGLGIVAALSLVILLVGYEVFRRASDRFVEEL